MLPVREKPPKGSWRPPRPPWKKVLPGGREILNTACPEGWHEYRERIRAMLDRQNGICCLSRHIPDCPGKLDFRDAVFEHQDGRGMGGGHRDDRIFDGDGLPINGAAHYRCNRTKGSLRINYNA